MTLCFSVVVAFMAVSDFCVMVMFLVTMPVEMMFLVAVGMQFLRRGGFVVVVAFMALLAGAKQAKCQCPNIVGNLHVKTF